MHAIVQEDIHNILSEDLPWSDLKDSTVLVTGAGGFIGGYIVQTLLALGNVKVIGIVRNLNKAQHKYLHCSNHDHLVLIEQDVCIPLEQKINADYIIHAASQASPKYFGSDPVGTLKANVLGTFNLLELAVHLQTKKFIFISTGEVYGILDDNKKNISEEYYGYVNFINIRSCYAESKRMAENMCICYAHQYGIQVNMLRLSHTYGPGIDLNDGRVFADFTKNIVKNEDINLYSDGSALRNFIYITDAILALFYILFKGQSSHAYNVASDKETSIIDLAHLLCNIFPEKQLKVRCNTKREGHSTYIKSESSRASYNTNKLKKLGWITKTDVSVGFKRMITSYL